MLRLHQARSAVPLARSGFPPLPCYEVQLTDTPSIGTWFDRMGALLEVSWSVAGGAPGSMSF
jgi:hypothetical protein